MGLLVATVLLFGAFQSAANQINVNSTQSAQPIEQSSDSHPFIRDGVAYSNQGIPEAEADKPAPKVVAAAITTSHVVKIPAAKRETKATPNYCNCLQAINQKFGKSFKTLNGFARTIPVESTTPYDIGFVVTYESFPGTNTGHIAHYYKHGDVIVLDWEANYDRCKFSSGRTLPIGSPLIKGYLPN